MIAVSGGIHSGKTTWVKNTVALSDRIIKSNFDLNDVFREFYIKTNIDSLRSNEIEHLFFQSEGLLSEVINNIRYHNVDVFSDKIIIQDRSIVDSLYYFTKYAKYIDAEQFKFFQDKMLEIFSIFAKDYYKMDYIFLMKPIRDRYHNSFVHTRPKNFDYNFQISEYNGIKSLYKEYCKDSIVLEESHERYTKMIKDMLNDV